MAGRFRSLEVADLGSELLLPADVISSNGTSCGGWNPVLYLEMTACESYNQRKKWVASEDSAKCPQHTISRTTCEICIETTRILSHREKKTGIQHNVKKDCAAVGRKLLSATFGRHGGTDLRFVGPQPDTSWSHGHGPMFRTVCLFTPQADAALPNYTTRWHKQIRVNKAVQGGTRLCSSWNWTRDLQSQVQHPNHCATEHTRHLAFNIHIQQKITY